MAEEETLDEPAVAPVPELAAERVAAPAPEPAAEAAAAAVPEPTDGRLEIRIQSEAGFLRRNLPIEIRDGHQQLVQTLRAGQPPVALAPGLYSVSAVLEDGETHRRHVHVRSGKTERVELAAERAMPRAATTRGAVLRGASRGNEGAPKAPSSRGVPRGASRGNEGEPKTGCTMSAEILDWSLPPTLQAFDGAREVSRQGGRWVFAPAADPPGDLEAVPFARITTPAERFEVSLPVNPRDHYPLNSCEVQAREGRRGLRVRVRLAPERRVANALERMAESGHLGSSAKVAREATELLADKYRDPGGAAFGGLLLHRLGRLEARPQWLERLARSSPWLPDSRVLLAALLARSDDGDERRRGLDLLLAAAPRRMMFTDGLSLALDLLRRWPGGAGSEERQRVLGDLSPVAARARWNATVLTVKKG